MKNSNILQEYTNEKKFIKDLKKNIKNQENLKQKETKYLEKKFNNYYNLTLKKITNCKSEI
jgi:hypothetical protein